MRDVVISITAGTVTEIRKAGSKWVIKVSNSTGFIFYPNIDVVSVGRCQVIGIGDTIGYNNIISTVVNIGVQMYSYMGNGTTTHTDVRLKNATNVKWARAGLIKPDASEVPAADNYTHNASDGTITTPEVQETYEWFTVWYIPA